MVGLTGIAGLVCLRFDDAMLRFARLLESLSDYQPKTNVQAVLVLLLLPSLVGFKLTYRGVPNWETQLRIEYRLATRRVDDLEEAIYVSHVNNGGERVDVMGRHSKQSGRNAWLSLMAFFWGLVEFWREKTGYYDTTYDHSYEG